MDSKKFDNLPSKAAGAHNIKLQIKYCDAHYQVNLNTASRAGKTGLLNLFSVISEDPSLPSFIARWDDRQQMIDIDPDPFDCVDRNLWLNARNGYRGHHTDRINNDPRLYQVDIQTPNGPVLKAIASLNIEASMRLELSVNVDAAFEGVIMRP